jgi:hypothetical protein
MYQQFVGNTDLSKSPKVASDLMREFSMYRNLMYFEQWGRQVLAVGPGLWEKFSSTPIPDVFPHHKDQTLDITLPHFYEVHMPYPALYIHFDGHTPLIGSREADGMFVFESCIDDPTLIINHDGPVLWEDIDVFVMVLCSKETWAVQTIPKQPTDFIHSMFTRREASGRPVTPGMYRSLRRVFGAAPRWTPEEALLLCREVEAQFRSKETKLAVNVEWHESVRQAFRVLVHLCTYINTNTHETRVVQEPDPDQVARLQQKLGGIPLHKEGRRNSVQRKLNKARNKIRITKIAPTEEKRYAIHRSGTGRVQDAHWRRGHHRDQWVGSGDNRRQVTKWIKPQRIHADSAVFSVRECYALEEPPMTDGVWSWEEELEFPVETYVYFIMEAETRRIKIGFSNDPVSRRDGMQTGNSQELIILGSFKGTRKDETILHERFSDFLVRGEWFAPESGLEEFAQTLIEREL